MDSLHPFFTALIPLVIIMDPLGNLPFFLLFTGEEPAARRTRVAALASLTAFAVLAFFALTGDLILGFFGIGLPAFQLAGGFVFFIYALQMLGLVAGAVKTSSEEEREGVEKENVAFVPLGIPLLAGPGAITTVVAWRQQADQPMGLPLLLAPILLACLAVFMVFRFGEWISRFLGVIGIRVITRLMGLLLAVIAVQYMVNGLRQVLQGAG